MAADVLRRRGLLEHAGLRCFWLPDQHAGRAFLSAGAEHHAGPCPFGAIWRLWLSGAGLLVSGAALYSPTAALKRRPDEAGFLEPQRRTGADGLHQPSAGRSEEHTSELQSLMRISYSV